MEKEPVPTNTKEAVPQFETVSLEELAGTIKGNINEDAKRVMAHNESLWRRLRTAGAVSSLEERQRKEIETLRVDSLNHIDALREGKGMSRREFLIGLAGLELTTAIPRYVEAIDSGRKEGEIYQEGLDRLRDAVLNADNELLAIYINAKGEDSRWIYEEGKASYVQLGSPERYQEFLREAESIEVFHTHPLALVYPDHEMRSRVREGKIPPPLLLPSILDITGAMRIIKSLDPEHSQRIKWSVVDPAGTWEYKLDRTNPYFEKITEALEQADKLLLQFYQQEDVQALIRKHNLAEIDPRLALSSLLVFQNELSQESQDLLKGLFNLEKKLFEPLQTTFDPEVARTVFRIDKSPIEEIVNLEASRGYFSRESLELRNLRALYNRIGVRLEFTSQ